MRGISPGKAVKALVDGASAALQRSRQRGELDEAIARLAALTATDARDLARLDSGPAPLGAAKRLLTLEGEDQIRVTPDDERCTAAEVISAGDVRTPRLAVEAWTVMRT